MSFVLKSLLKGLSTQNMGLCARIHALIKLQEWGSDRARALRTHPRCSFSRFRLIVVLFMGKFGTGQTEDMPSEQLCVYRYKNTMIELS